MARKYIDCREHPGPGNCTVAISADTEDELIEAAINHGISAHDMQDSPELRKELKTLVKDGSPHS